MDCCCPRNDYEQLGERKKVVIKETPEEQAARERVEELARQLGEGKQRAGEGCYFLVFCATIREIRDFNREEYGTN
eukprot:SAG31_NODE_40493_length_280_cov_1.055249_1_plen_75_part_01